MTNETKKCHLKEYYVKSVDFQKTLAEIYCRKDSLEGIAKGKKYSKYLR